VTPIPRARRAARRWASAAAGSPSESSRKTEHPAVSRNRRKSDSSLAARCRMSGDAYTFLRGIENPRSSWGSWGSETGFWDRRRAPGSRDARIPRARQAANPLAERASASMELAELEPATSWVRFRSETSANPLHKRFSAGSAGMKPLGYPALARGFWGERLSIPKNDLRCSVPLQGDCGRAGQSERWPVTPEVAGSSPVAPVSQSACK
jgi:hypothetical protein